MKKSLSPILAAILALMLTFGLCACGENDKGNIGQDGTLQSESDKDTDSTDKKNDDKSDSSSDKKDDTDKNPIDEAKDAITDDADNTDSTTGSNALNDNTNTSASK